MAREWFMWLLLVGVLMLSCSSGNAVGFFTDKEALSILERASQEMLNTEKMHFLSASRMSLQRCLAKLRSKNGRLTQAHLLEMLRKAIRRGRDAAREVGEHAGTGLVGRLTLPEVHVPTFHQHPAVSYESYLHVADPKKTPPWHITPHEMPEEVSRDNHHQIKPNKLVDIIKHHFPYRPHHLPPLTNHPVQPHPPPYHHHHHPSLQQYQHHTSPQPFVSHPQFRIGGNPILHDLQAARIHATEGENASDDDGRIPSAFVTLADLHAQLTSLSEELRDVLDELTSRKELHS
eukprot:scpid88460/ scgid19323/ 